MVMQVLQRSCQSLYTQATTFVILFLNNCDPRMHYGGYVQCTCDSFVHTLFLLFLMLDCVEFQFCFIFVLSRLNLTFNFGLWVQTTVILGDSRELTFNAHKN